MSKLGGGWDNTGKGPLKAGGDKVNYSDKKQKVQYGIVKNLKFLGMDGQILTAGKSGKIPPGQLNESAGGGPVSTSESFKYFYHPDHLGSSSYITDASGEVYQHLEYFAFGETFVEEHSNTDRTPYLYNGKELDEETGLYYYSARYFDPKTSVFISVDPLAENMPFISPYAYCFNNPIMFTDPTGLQPDGDGPSIWQRAKALVGIGRLMGTRIAGNQRYTNDGNLRGKRKKSDDKGTAIPEIAKPDPIPSPSSTPDPTPTDSTPTLEQDQTPTPTPETPQPSPGPVPPRPCVPQNFNLNFNWQPNRSIPQNSSFALGQLSQIANQWNGCRSYSQVSITINTPISIERQFMANSTAGGILNNTLMFNRAQWIQRQLTGMGIRGEAFINNSGNRRLNINWGLRGSAPSASVGIR